MFFFPPVWKTSYESKIAQNLKLDHSMKPVVSGLTLGRCFLFPLCQTCIKPWLLNLVRTEPRPLPTPFIRLSFPLFLSPSHLFESAFHVDALVPRSSRVGEAVTGVPPSGDVHLLPAQVPECLGHHHHPVVRQRWGVLGDERRWSEICDRQYMGSGCLLVFSVSTRNLKGKV